MAEFNYKITIDTSDLDEAIVKAKILNDELEKAKSLVKEMANSNNFEISVTKVIPSLNVDVDQVDVKKILYEVQSTVRCQSGCR